MCSVTFWPIGRSYRLAMNRDELLARVAALPPSVHDVNGRRVLHPREPGGGTWISLNDAGTSLALVNWYAETARAPVPVASRGNVVLATRTADHPKDVTARLNALPLSHTNPFRLIGFFPELEAVHEWRWNLVALTEVAHPWAPRQWLSSGFDEAGAQRERGNVFNTLRTEPDAGSATWLRRLHASHDPVVGPFSTCMHRSDAVTVSYTEIEVNPRQRVMGYAAGCPCQRGAVAPATVLPERAGSP